MKGYAKVKVTIGDRGKIKEFIKKIESDKKSLQYLYDSTVNDDTFNSLEGWIIKHNCHDTPNHCDFMLRKYHSEWCTFNYRKYVTGYEDFQVIETIQSKAIRKIEELSTEDEILLDDELMKIWNKYILS